MRLSFSQINYFLECPHKYKLLVIDQIKFPKNIESVFGSIIHQSLQFLYTQDPIPSLEELLRFYQTHWPQKNDYDFQTDQIEAIYFAEGAALLSNFYRDNYNFKPKIVDLENHFEISLENPDGEIHCLTGVIDRIDNLGNNQYEIIDYKTSRTMAQKNPLEENLQLAIYHLALTQRWPQIKPEDIKLSLYFLRTRNKVTTSKNQEDLQQTKENILSIIKEIETSDFMPTPTSFCRYLPYKLTCPMWQHSYKTEKTLVDQKINDSITEFFKIQSDKTAINEKIKEIKQIILNYMETEKLGRVFGEAGYFSKTIKKNFDYDLEKLESELKANNLWQEVLSLDEDKLDLLLKRVPHQLKTKILSSRVFTRDTISLRSTKKNPKT